ncbi:hypothetical protein PVAND_003043 [Polypedilum vanderplanki]|uniref:Peptidase S1 domain-containing protein n=1 Tax=Polypedilum vanderplanki TaxID=319348 RepID=A0A9J6BSV3_POLVA|nr:hypothetical protein PVAND_003043 [Polypedilum vanderplanki]
MKLKHFQFLFFFSLLLVSEAEKDKKIIDDTSTSIEKHSYLVSILFNGKHICGGSLIKKNFVLTAAHCIPILHHSHYSIRYGSNKVNSGGTVTKVTDITIHHNYNASTPFDYDIAILKTSNPIEGVNVIPISIAVEEEYDIPFMLVGWGALNSDETASNQLLEANVKMINRKTCQKMYVNKKITDRMICAAANGKDACHGDSGRSVAHNGGLVGIVSWGRGCADQLYPDVYTNVAYFKDWIDGVLTDNSTMNIWNNNLNS